ncbi:hypothetical protein PR003_g18439 [Phytophthora rubi]|uniref:RxLR effector protein n=1 Tax=Phytophthora rubi TaxID=129364 RepID=A0A6A3JQD9_9STRA|nr:hypothetical protein PR001_g19700 [Phytophthora rubi]KAE9001706.1 hypothetical protein PR002_g17841 [Phytophthora rubi]KAE9317606.1 hypothetical protein PR003_g18439 [Phytophthora rubi]
MPLPALFPLLALPPILCNPSTFVAFPPHTIAKATSPTLPRSLHGADHLCVLSSAVLLSLAESVLLPHI